MRYKAHVCVFKCPLFLFPPLSLLSLTLSPALQKSFSKMSIPSTAALPMANESVSCSYDLSLLYSDWAQDYNCTFTTCLDLAHKCGMEQEKYPVTQVDPTLVDLKIYNQSLPVYCFYYPDYNEAILCAYKLYPNTSVNGIASKSVLEQEAKENEEKMNQDNGGVSKSKVGGLLFLSLLGLGLMF